MASLMSAFDTFQRLLFPYGHFRGQVLLDMVRHRWFIRLRWGIVVFVLVVLGVERLQHPEFRRPAGVFLAVIALAGFNVLWTAISRWLMPGRSRSRAGSKREAHELESAIGRAPLDTLPPSNPPLHRVVLFANAQMAVDLFILTVILRYSGGIESPMVMFYLFHVLMAALLLRPLNALLQGLWAMVLYGGLTIGESVGWVAPHFSFLPTTIGESIHTHGVFVSANIAVLAAGIFGTLYFTLQISARLDDQERELQVSNVELQKAHRSREELQRRRSRFMQTAAHQLKSPFATIETLAGLIRDGTVDPRQADDLIRRIIARCGLGMELVSELLTLARVEQSPSTREAPAARSIGRVARQTVERATVQAAAKNIELHLSTEADEADRVLVDERDLEDCLANLLDNAIKYTPTGGRIEVATSRNADEIRLSVRDSGMGIAEEHLENVFEPFCRGPLALAAEIPGTGLGLTIVREVVERAGGRITVQSRVGKGTEFVLGFPAAVASTGTVAGV